jgi:hypothetical protein
MVRPEDVVDFAKDPTTALHYCFTWDDTKAAKEYRLQQARQVLRAVVSVLPGDDPLKYRAMVSLKDDRYNGLGYRVMADVLTDGRLRGIMLAEALAEMQVFMAKYEGLKELAEIFAAMKRVVKTKPARRSSRKGKYKQPPQPTV